MQDDGHVGAGEAHVELDRAGAMSKGGAEADRVFSGATAGSPRCATGGGAQLGAAAAGCGAAATPSSARASDRADERRAQPPGGGRQLHRSPVTRQRPAAAGRSGFRLISVSFTAASGGATATIGSNRNIAPPGWYMLFAVDSVGRPSVAKWVHLT